jgi:hypothetical protein
MFLVADLNAREYFAESCQQLFFERVVKFGSTFRKGVEEGIENRLSESIEVLFEESIVLFFFRNRQKQSYVIFRDSLLQLRLRILILSLMKKLTNREPEAVANQSSVFI